MAIEIKDISKNYGKKQALKNVSLIFDKGIYALLGSNGAGKSTMLNILVTSLMQSSGQVLFNGKDIRNKDSLYTDNLGYLPQTPKFYKNFTAEEFLKYIAVLKGVSKKGLGEKITELLELVNLREDRKTKIGNFSGGMVQRIGIAQALINDPQILILDEPTAGLDPVERIRLRNLISNVSKDKTVIIATHIVSDVEYIANRIILLKNGEVCRDGRQNELTDEITGTVWEVKTDEDGFKMLSEKFNFSNIYLEKGIYTLRIVSVDKPAENAKIAEPTLEDVFFYHSKLV